MIIAAVAGGLLAASCAGATPTGGSRAVGESGPAIAEPLVGPLWMLTTIVESDGPSAPVTGSHAALQFAADGAVNGNLGCNSATTTVRVEGSTLRPSDVVQTAAACATPGVMELEADVGGVLRNPMSWSITDGALTLAPAIGPGPQLVFEAQAPTAPVPAPPSTSAPTINPTNGVRIDIEAGCPASLDGQRDEPSTAATWTVNPDALGLADAYVPGAPTAAMTCRYAATDGPPGAPSAGGRLLTTTLLGSSDAERLATAMNQLEPSDVVSACSPPNDRPRYTAVVFAVPGRSDTDVWLKQWIGCPDLTNGARQSGQLINGFGADFMAVLDELAAPAPPPPDAGASVASTPDSSGPPAR